MSTCISKNPPAAERSARDSRPRLDVGVPVPGCRSSPSSGRAASGGRAAGCPERADAHGERSPGRKGRSCRRVLRRSDRARAGELPDFRNSHQPLSRLHRSVGHRQACGGAGQHRRRRDEQGNPRRHREGGRRAAEGEVPRSVPGGLVPGWRGHVDQHERQRGHGQHRARADRATRRANTKSSTRTTT